MTHVALLLRPEAAPASSLVVRADAITRDDGVLALWREGRCVHRVAAHLVLDAVPCPTQRDADARLLAHRSAGVGGATVHVAELAPPVRKGHRAASGIPAEGLRVVLEGRR